MHCTRVLSALGSHPQPGVIPVDLVMCLSLSQHQPLYELLSNASLRPAQQSCQPAHRLQRAVSLRSLRRSPSHRHASPSVLPSSQVSSGPRSCFRRDSSGQTKKRVVFADAKGLALTAVHLFIPDSSFPTSTLVKKPVPVRFQGQQSPLNKLSQQSPSNKLQSYKLRLGFPQPVLDISIARLREMRVQLQSCHISENSLSGRVRVSHVSTEKAVHVRVTFDSWRNHHDIPCVFLQQQRFNSSEVDVFAFDLNLPKNIDPGERIEFCVCLRTEATTHWDDNDGQNYRVYIEKDRAHANKDNANCYYSTLSKYQPTSWPSHVSLSMKNYADPQSSLSSRVQGIGMLHSDS
ncbi:protein phosphatase 1 regulatory subunit 3C-B [Cheilinus undulatus]|uniref:protein phosphatase 1 regulatory subunit 3C-B n=1 Tax=Cheilinus undulatus TaxID=241271 RepID=UPI001BD5811E|nr:protein phosphatase 1 regulatory subunit 3C-B [Cheilinus undulatus]